MEALKKEKGLKVINLMGLYHLRVHTMLNSLTLL